MAVKKINSIQSLNREDFGKIEKSLGLRWLTLYDQVINPIIEEYAGSFMNGASPYHYFWGTVDDKPSIIKTTSTMEGLRYFYLLKDERERSIKNLNNLLFKSMKLAS